MSCCCCNDDLCCTMKRYLGQTVTIFTNSGGLSGSGFTGVLIYVDECIVKLVTNIGGAPACPVGSDCGYPGYGCGGGYGYGGYGYGYGYGGYGYGGYGYGRGYGYGSRRGGCCGNYNFLGSVTEIPICSISSFVRNAI